MSPFAGAMASMGENDRNNPSIAAVALVRRRRWCRFVLAILIVASLGLGGFLFRARLLPLWHIGDELGNRFSPDALADYVPEDSQAVLAVNLRQLREAPAGRQQLAPVVQQLIRRSGGRVHWIDLLGINALDDLDTLRISFAPATGEEPLWLLRGPLDRSRLQIGPDKLQETNLDRFRVWVYSDRRENRTTLIAPVGDMLVVSESRVRLRTALEQASNPQPILLHNRTLDELLTKVDRQQTVWLAAAFKGLGPVTEIEDYWLKLLLRPLLAHAESAYGGIRCAEDLSVELHFRAATEEEAGQLEMSLQSICDIIREGASLLVRQKELLPLLRLLGTAQIHREGTMILLRCRLTADRGGR